MDRRWQCAAVAVLLALGLASEACAVEQQHRFRPPDAEALRIWADMLRKDRYLQQDARRHGFIPRRDLAVLRINLDDDDQPELILYAELLSQCGSAGCVAHILTRRDGRWVSACETHVEGWNGFVVDTVRSAGWRNLRGTWRMSWREDPSQPAGVRCVQGDTVPRSKQGQPAGRHRS